MKNCEGRGAPSLEPKIAPGAPAGAASVSLAHCQRVGDSTRKGRLLRWTDVPVDVREVEGKLATLLKAD